MLRSITATQLAEWRAYAMLEPFDEERADIRAAQITWAIVNVNRDTRRHPRPLPLSDFVLRFDEDATAPRRQRTWQELKALGQLASAMYASENQRGV